MMPARAPPPWLRRAFSAWWLRGLCGDLLRCDGGACGGHDACDVALARARRVPVHGGADLSQPDRREAREPDHGARVLLALGPVFLIALQTAVGGAGAVRLFAPRRAC